MYICPPSASQFSKNIIFITTVDSTNIYISVPQEVIILSLMLNLLCEPYIAFTVMSDISHWQNEYSKDVFWFHELNEEKPSLVLTDFLWQE